LFLVASDSFGQGFDGVAEVGDFGQDTGEAAGVAAAVAVLFD
jgi:hypothetical protein